MMMIERVEIYAKVFRLGMQATTIENRPISALVLAGVKQLSDVGSTQSRLRIISLVSRNAPIKTEIWAHQIKKRTRTCPKSPQM